MAYVFDYINNTLIDDEDKSLGNKLAVLDPDLEKVLQELNEKFGPGTIQEGTQGIPTPPKTIEREMFQNAFKDSLADGGMLVKQNFDGLRKGYSDEQLPVNINKEGNSFRVTLLNGKRKSVKDLDTAIELLKSDGQTVRYLGADQKQVLDWIKSQTEPITTDDIAKYIADNNLSVRRNKITSIIKNNPEYEGKVKLVKEYRANFLNKDGTIKQGTVDEITKMINNPKDFPTMESIAEKLKYKGTIKTVIDQWSNQTKKIIPEDRFRLHSYRGTEIAEKIIKAFDAQGDNPNIAKLARQFVNEMPGVNSINGARNQIRKILVDYADYIPRPNEPKSENEMSYYKKRRQNISLALQRMGDTSIKNLMDDILINKNQEYVKLANENPEAILNNKKLRFALETTVDVDTGEFRLRNDGKGLTDAEIIERVKRGDLFTEDHIKEVRTAETAPKKSGEGVKLVKGINIEYPTNKQAATTNFNQSFLPNAKKYISENPNGKNVQKIVDVLNEYGLQIKIGNKTYGTTEKIAWDKKTKTSPRYNSNFNVFETKTSGSGGEGTSFKSTATSLKDKLDKSKMFTSRIPGGAVALTPLDFTLSMAAGVPLPEALASAGSYLIKDPYLGKAVNVPLAIAADVLDPEEALKKGIARGEKAEEFLQGLLEDVKSGAGEQPDINPFQAAEGGRAGFSNGGAAGADDNFLKELEFYFTNEDAELPKMQTYKETMNPIEVLNDIIDPRNYPYYADILTRSGLRIGEFGVRILPAVGKLVADTIQKGPFKITGSGKNNYVQDYTDTLPSNIKGTGIFSEFLENITPTTLEKKVGLDKLIKTEEQKQIERGSTVGPKVFADTLGLGAEVTAPIFPGLKLLRAYAANRNLPVNDVTQKLLIKEIDEVLEQRGMNRREFLQATGAGATLILAKMLGFGDELARTTKVAQKVAEKATGGVPPYFFKLVEKIKKNGKQLEPEFDPRVENNMQFEDFVMKENMATGEITIQKIKETGVYTGDDIVEGVVSDELITYRPGENVLGKDGKFYRTAEQYEESTVKPDSEGKMKDYEEGLDSIEEIIELLPNKLKMSELEAAGYNVEAFPENIKQLLINDIKKID